MRVLMLTALMLCLAARPTASTLQAPESAPRSMFELYEENRRQGIPNYITEDFLLLSYAMLLDQAVGLAEETRLGPSFAQLIERLAVAVSQQGDSEVRLANQRFLAVIAALLQDQQVLEDGRAEFFQEEDVLVREELRRVLAAEGFERSELMVQRLDYSQFQVRGRYAATPELERYFRAVRYAGTVLFPVVASPATGISEDEADRLTAQALQLTSLMAGDKEIAETWRQLTTQLEWWFGPADDLAVGDYSAVIASSGELDLPTVRQRLLEQARTSGRQPRILGGLVELDQLEEGRTASDVLTGWRFFPQRFTPDGAAFQQLVHGGVGPYLGQGHPKSLSFAGGQPVKGFPSALELMSLLGSEQAGQQLDRTDERNYQGYDEAAERAGVLLAQANGLTAEHFNLMRFWLEDDPASERRVNSALALWTYHRYANLLYAKPSYSGVSKGFRLPPSRDTAWLEPAAELYARLAESARGLGEKADCFACGEFADLLERCVRIAVWERAGLDLEVADIAFLNDLDFEIFKLTGERDEPIIVDLHTDVASGQVLQEGIGWPEVVEKPLATHQISRGVLFQHYELKQSLEQRLTDATWVRLLEEGTLEEGTLEEGAFEEGAFEEGKTAKED